MTLEQQVVSLDLAKRLKELNVKQDSLFWWCQGRFDQPDKSKWELNDSIDTHARENVSAFTSSELGEMLPLEINGENLQLWREKGRWSWDVAYNTSGNSGKDILWEQADTEADARAKMLIHLIESNLIPASHRG